MKSYKPARPDSDSANANAHATVIAMTPQHHVSPEIAIAACRAGALGILDLGIRTTGNAVAPAVAELIRSAQTTSRFGLRCDLFGDPCSMLDGLAERIGLQGRGEGAALVPVPVLILAGIRSDEGKQAAAAAHRLAREVYLEVRDLPEALAAQQAGFDGLIFKGNEAGGRVSQRAAFILAQEVAGKLAVPYWIQGGIGVQSAAAVALSGATGVVLCEQLWLAAEAPPAPAHASWEGLDGSETVLAGAGDAQYRCFSRTGRAVLNDIAMAVAHAADWEAVLLAGLLARDAGVLAAGQDLAFASALASRYGTVGRIVTAIMEGMQTGVALPASQLALAPGAPLAAAHGTRFPIAQGPMTRVSDVAPFARAVADEGALPFVALAVMRGPEIATMLAATRDLLGALPWGVGILGFMPLELRQEQMQVLRDVRPPFAIIAGGRPSQARELDELGIITYLHVPSPGLLRGFLDAGARRFVFEGSECGGHTGPRSSFVLWQQAIDILLAANVKESGAVQVLFAGGIHDALSAAMVAVLAAPLVAAGMKIGVLMGTAYLFTHEIVASGAIVKEFQRQAIACEDTSLLQSGVGIYTRCARTAFCGEFEALRRQLVVESTSEDDTLMALETMNIGRLRIAAKGITRNIDPAATAEQRYVATDDAMQRREGLYMLGEVARLRRRACSMAELHAGVGLASMELLRLHAASRPAAPDSASARSGFPEDIAIVGMACHLPRAQGLRAYWQNIIRGVDAISDVPEERWSATLLFDERRDAAGKSYSKRGGFLDDIAFDPQRYGIAPATLASIEPAQLLTLEVARLALEDAGFDRRPFARERTACILAVGGMSDLGSIYNFRTLLPQYLAKVEGLSDAARDQIIDTLFEHELPQWTEDSFPGILGNVFAGRVANRLDLGGSNFTVDAACAASLAALEVGFRQLRSGEADVALVGGVDCTNSPIGYMGFAQTHALSPRGRSRPFDASADGIAISEGVGALVLKRLSDAERDGDRIYALVKGVGSASDGRHRSLTAPHPPGQVRALQRAYQDARVDPAKVTLIEAHGTGTPLGDKSEIAALGTLLGASAEPYCALGSVKSMIGHSKVAAGMAGMIKATLALHHRMLPPTIGVESPAPALQAAGASLYVNSEARPWLHAGRDHPRYCGVSAFGFGGTNFHAVLGEYTGAYRAADVVSLQPREVELFAFAGATRAEIAGTLQRLLDGLADMAQPDLAQLAFSLYREQHVLRRANGGEPCRLIVAATSAADLVAKLERARALLAGTAEIGPAANVLYRESVGAVGGVCFLFPGQGAQRINMLRELVTSMPSLHANFSAAAIADVMYPRPAFDDATRAAQQRALNATDIAQPALGMAGMAAFDVLTGFGLQPDFLAGHSYGEYPALCASGAITREELLRLSMARGRLCAEAPAGAMAALDAGGAEVADAIARHGLAVSIANLNAPDQTIIAGTVDAIETAHMALAGDGLRVKQLAVGTAFHCAHMADIQAALAAELEQVAFQPPRVPVYSNLSASPFPADAGEIGALLARHIAEPVRFADEIDAMYAAGARVFIECGPGLTLTGLVGRVLGARPHTVLAIDAPGRDGWVQLGQLLANAIAVGLPIDLAPWFAGRGLAERSLDDLFAAARAEPGPLIWRVNGGRAVPWASRPAAPRAPAQLIDCRSTPPAPPVPSATPITVTSPPWRSTMKTEDESIPDDFPRYGGTGLAVPSVSATELMQIDQSFGQLLAFQSEQQKTLHQFFDFHARLAGYGHTTSTVAAPRDVTAAPGMRAPVQAALAPAPAPGQAVRIPVLPSFTQNDTAVATLAAPPPPPAPAIHTGTVAAAAHVATVATAAAADTAPATVAEFSAELLKAVSARTGYPVDMLDLDAHMEADLGIDSIKRIEIFSGLTQRHSLVGDRDEETVIEELSGFKSLRDVVAWYAGMLEPAVPILVGDLSPKKAPAPLSLSDEEVEPYANTAEADPVQCYVVQACDAALAPAVPGDDTSPPGPVLLVGQPSALADALHAQLTARGHAVRQLVPGTFAPADGDWRYVADLASAQSVAQSAGQLDGLLAGAPLAALIDLMGWDHASPDAPLDHVGDARALFLLLKLFAPQMKAGGGRLVNLTGFDGRFGLDGSAVETGVEHDEAPGHAFIASAGTLGVAKSAAREWSELHVKCIDAAPELAPAWLAGRVVAEMFSADTQVEVGYSAAGRCCVGMEARSMLQGELGALGALGGLHLEQDCVVLVTGGACGITAELTHVLAKKYRPRLVLVGRSALPRPESAATFGIDNQEELRQLLTARMRAAGQRITPVLVEAAVAQLRRDREILANLAALRSAGCHVEYHSIDVRDAPAFGGLIDDVYARFGRIDGVLHGAGIISDKLIASKPVEAFDAVFETKVIPALVLERKLRLDALRFIVFFSSVAGRFGNIGQSDYSAANEVLNKLAGRLGHGRPWLHAVAINWGPWDAGMVSDDLRKLYAARGIRPIGRQEGRHHFLDALERGAAGQPEIVISSSVAQIAALRLGRQHRPQSG